MQRLPRALRRDTIYECIVEVRCAPGHESAADLIPGMVFEKLKDLFIRLTDLPLSKAPKELLAAQPQFAYQSTRRLEGTGPMLLIGPQVVAVTYLRPYPGWAAMHPVVERCIRTVLETKLLGRAERCSIRYVNLLPVGKDEYDLSQLKLQLTLGDFKLRREAIAVRSEVEMDDCTTVVEVLSGATVSNPDGRFAAAKGVLCNVDTVKFGPFSDFNRELPDVLDAIHNTEKKIYFGLLAEDTLAKLEPIWN